MSTQSLLATLQYLQMSSYYYYSKYVTLYFYIFLAIKIDKKDIMFHACFNDTWQRIINAENSICRILFEHRVPLTYLNIDIKYDTFYTRFNFNTCFNLYIMGECEFRNSYVKNLALYRLFIFHLILNKELYKICVSVL